MRMREKICSSFTWEKLHLIHFQIKTSRLFLNISQMFVVLLHRLIIFWDGNFGFCRLPLCLWTWGKGRYVEVHALYEHMWGSCQKYQIEVFGIARTVRNHNTKCTEFVEIHWNLWLIADTRGTDRWLFGIWHLHCCSWGFNAADSQSADSYTFQICDGAFSLGSQKNCARPVDTLLTGRQRCYGNVIHGCTCWQISWTSTFHGKVAHYYCPASILWHVLWSPQNVC